jgi:hypothetical protein
MPLSISGRKSVMYKNLIMVFALFLLSAGMAMAEEMTEENMTDVATVEFTGVAVELYEPAEGLMGAPTIWAVNVTSAEEGAICSDIINVTVYQSTPGPWGTYDENVTVGDMVEVYGAYVEDETGCIVTLQGSADYYLKQTEVVEETEVAEETGEVTE